MIFTKVTFKSSENFFSQFFLYSSVYILDAVLKLSSLIYFSFPVNFQFIITRKWKQSRENCENDTDKIQDFD